MMNEQNDFGISLDTHVHFYDGFGASELLEHAWTNLSQSIRSRGLRNAIPAVIWTRQQRESALAGQLPEGSAWQVREDSKTDAGFRVQARDGRELFVFRGVQFVSAEGLEVLVGALPDHSDGFIGAHQGKPVRELLDSFCDEYPVILPWGFGKWLGKRGQIILELLDSEYASRFVLGDNSGRPAFWSPVKAFVKAAQVRVPVVPGTDPLPVSGQIRHVGRSGVLLDHFPSAVFDNGALLREALLKRSPYQVARFDRREALLSFFLNQLKMRLP